MRNSNRNGFIPVFYLAGMWVALLFGGFVHHMVGQDRPTIVAELGHDQDGNRLSVCQEKGGINQ